MNYFIYHSKNFRDSCFYSKTSTIFNQEQAKEAFHSNGYEAAGPVAADDLELAYEKSQNDSRFNDRKGWNEAKPCRSTSVGDIIIALNKAYIVASFGFDEITLFGAVK